MQETNQHSIGQTGEYLVASQLCRLGLVATTFTRNVPGFDILALDMKKQKEIRIQIKTIKPSGDWQLNARNFLKIEFDNRAQRIEGIKEENQADFFVFVRLGEKGYGHDKFYIVPCAELKKIVHNNYKEYLAKKGGIRPKNPQSTHTAIKEKDIKCYENRWEIFKS